MLACDVDCHLLFYYFFFLWLQEGAGRRVGEQTEHLWSVTKPFTKRGRYATKAHWVDGLNNLLRRLSLRKQIDFPKLLEGKLKRLPKTEGERRCFH